MWSLFRTNHGRRRRTDLSDGDLRPRVEELEREVKTALTMIVRLQALLINQLSDESPVVRSVRSLDDQDESELSTGLSTEDPGQK